jgi:hypothetical protein
MIAIIIIGTIMMFSGVGVIYSAYSFPARRKVFERCGAYLILAGLTMWGIAMAAI